MSDEHSTSAPSFLQNPFGERYLHEINRQVFASDRAADVFSRRLKDDFGTDNTLFVIIGSDSGLLLEHLRELPLGKGSRRLIVEADDLYPLIASDADAAATDDRTHLCRFDDWQEVFAGCKPDSYVHGGLIKVIESLGCLHDHSARYLPMLRAIKARVTELAHHCRIAIANQAFARTQLRNLCDNVRPASELRSIGEGHAAVVLGGGPSLDDSIDWVVENRECLFVIAVSRLCGKLQGLGLRPDVVICVDPQEMMYDISKQGLLWTDVPLISAYHVSPPVLQQWRGPTFYLGSLLPWNDGTDKGPANIASMGPTVSHAGAWFALECGFELVLLSGLDLCFAVGGGTHAGGSVEEAIGLLPSRCDAAVRTYSGRMAGTSIVLQHGLESLENIGRHANTERTRLFNLSPNAAHVESIPLIDVADVSLPDSRPVLELAAESDSRRAHLAQVARMKDKARHRFGQIKRLCDEGMELVDLVGRTGDQRRFEALQRKLRRVQRNLDKDHGPWFHAIKMYAAGELLRSVRPAGIDGDDVDGQDDWIRNYFATVQRTADTYLTLLEAGETRLRMRLAELEPSANVDELLDFWTEDHTPGRVLSLAARLEKESTSTDEEEPSAATRARIANAAEAFLATLSDSGDTDFSRRTRATTLDPHNLLRSLSFLFDQKSIGDLVPLVERLSTLSAPNDVFGVYATGLCAELSGDRRESLDHYRGVLDRFGDWFESETGVPTGLEALLETTLQRIVDCYLTEGDGESATESLALLTQISPAYAPRYAHLLHLLGRHDEALVVLEERMRSAPGDWRSLLQMGEIYTTLQAVDAARTVRRMADEIRRDTEPSPSRRVA